MQIYALDETGEEIAAPKAFFKKNYTCPFCFDLLRVRSGPFIRTHFFHHKPTSFCAGSGKTATHIKLQEKLIDLLPDKEAKEEVRFPQISRIADIYWEKEKVVFEVQVSPISGLEVQERIKAYRSIGIEVVWILHNFHFDKRKMTAAEHFLSGSTHYYASHNEKGIGHFYDRFVYDFKGIKQLTLFKKEVDLSSVLRNPTVPASLPPQVSCRSSWRLSFKGDILSSTHFNPNDMEKAKRIEAFIIKSKPKKSIFQKVNRFFRFIGYLILDTV